MFDLFFLVPLFTTKVVAIVARKETNAKNSKQIIEHESIHFASSSFFENLDVRWALQFH